MKRRFDGVKHIRAPHGDALRLYGINKWANDNGIDIVLHIHFNDYPRINHRIVGKYSGFTIYAPEKQLPNSRASLELARSVLNQTKKYFPVSDHPLEKAGIIEDQDLIAVGTRSLLYGAAFLVEYGYIYESQIVSEITRPIVFRELAYQTYLGLKKYFDVRMENFAYDSFVLPHTWRNILYEGMRSEPDVFALQFALAREGLYPPADSGKNDCPPNGNFGKCTRAAVIAFQKKYGLEPTGSVDDKTLEKLNNLH